MSEHCSQCGESADEFKEGVCLHCWTQNQTALDLHNAQYDRWQLLNSAERWAEIMKAARTP